MHRLDKAYQAFFQRVAAGEQPGYPRFQGRDRYKSFTYPQVGEHGGARLENGALVLSKIGRIVVRWSRPLEGTPKTVTVSREADGWYVLFSCANVPTQSLSPTGRETGIDVGLKVCLVTAEGEVVENPRYYRRGEQRLARAQRRVSRRKKGSNRRKKAAVLLARAHQTVKRQRTDHHHKTALALVRAYDTIYHEAIPARQPQPTPRPDCQWERWVSPEWGQPQGGSQQEHPRRRVGPFPVHPRLQGSMRREASGSGQPSIHQPGLQRVWGVHAQIAERAHPYLPVLRAGLGPRRECGQEHFTGRAGPSGSRRRADGDDAREIRLAPGDGDQRDGEDQRHDRQLAALLRREVVVGRDP